MNIESKAAKTHYDHRNDRWNDGLEIKFRSGYVDSTVQLTPDEVGELIFQCEVWVRENTREPRGQCDERNIPDSDGTAYRPAEED